MSRPEAHHGERGTTAVRLPVALHERLKATAEDRDVSVSWLINRAATAYLDRLDASDAALLAGGDR